MPSTGPGSGDPGTVEIPEGLDWFIWYPIVKGVTKLTELQDSWTIVDLIEAHMAIDVTQRAEMMIQNESAAKLPKPKKPKARPRAPRSRRRK